MEKAEKTHVPAETQTARIFNLLYDIWQYDGPDVRQFIKNEIRPMPKKYLQLLFQLVLISFIPSFICIWLGISENSRWLLFIGGLWRAACTILLLVALTPIGLLIEVARGGREDSSKRWAEMISGTFIGELFFTLVVMLLLSEIKARLDLLPILIMGSMILGMAGSAYFGKGFIAKCTGLIMIMVIVTLVFPDVSVKARGANRLQHFMIDPDKLEDRTVAFFDPNGAPLAWYARVVIDKESKADCLELFTRPGKHPSNNDELKPVDKKIADLIFEKKTQILHPANIKRSGANRGPNTSQVKGGQAGTSKTWKFRYEIPAGQQGYKKSAFSGWAPARIDRWDSEVKVVTFGPDGKEAADFEGTRAGRNSYRGFWRMRNGSGQGDFYFRLRSSNFIEGTMNDTTQDTHLVKIYLENS